jgi:hypothetical protein
MDKEESKKLGNDVAKAGGYDAQAIVHVFMAALHYSGFHGFAEEVQECWNHGAEREEEMAHLPQGSLKVGFWPTFARKG